MIDPQIIGLTVTQQVERLLPLSIGKGSDQVFIEVVGYEAGHAGNVFPLRYGLKREKVTHEVRH